MKCVLEMYGTLDRPESEDGGQAIILGEVAPDHADSNLFMRIQSWRDYTPDQEGKSWQERHPEAAILAGKKVKVTIEWEED